MGATSEMFIGIQDSIINLSHEAEQGNIPLLDAVIEMRKSRVKLETCLGLIKEFESEQITNIEEQAKEYPEGYKGAKFEVRAGRKTFNFKHLDSWNKLDTEKKELEKTLKGVFEMHQKNVLTATADGEAIELPTVSYAKSSLVVKLPK